MNIGNYVIERQNDNSFLISWHDSESGVRKYVRSHKLELFIKQLIEEETKKEKDFFSFFMQAMAVQDELFDNPNYHEVIKLLPEQDQPNYLLFHDSKQLLEYYLDVFIPAYNQVTGSFISKGVIRNLFPLELHQLERNMVL